MLISKNSYLILWLTPDADEKLLNKRHKEILKILGIDEVPEYENDFSFIDYQEIRTAENVKWAFHELKKKKKKLYQDFLWFQLVSAKDEKLFKKLYKWDILEAINWRWELYKQTWKFHYLKNYAISLLLCYENQEKFNDLDFSWDWSEIVKSLHECIESNKFWKEFINIINLSSETPVSDVEIRKFKSEISQNLAEKFFDLSEELEAPELYIEYNNVFWINAKELDDNKNVTEPLSIIEKNSEKIKKLDLEYDLDEIIDLINEIEEEINKLKKIWLADNPKISKIRDNVASSIRSLWISLYNDYWNSQSSKDFIKEALEIVWSITLKNKLEEDLKVINENIYFEWWDVDDEDDYEDEDYEDDNDDYGYHSSYQSTNNTKKWYRYSQSIDRIIPVDELKLTVPEVNKLVSMWWKFVCFPYCYSVIVFTQKNPWTVYFVPPWASWFWKALKSILISLIFWRRWIPRGPIYTIGCVFTNLFWWKNLTNDIMWKLRDSRYY